MNQPACTTTTMRGAPCRSFALPNSKFCVMHDPTKAAAVAEARRRGGTVAMKLRVLQGKRDRLDTPKALVWFVSNVVQDTLAGTVQPDVARAVLYGVSIQRALIDASGTEARLAEVERLLARRRPG